MQDAVQRGRLTGKVPDRRGDTHPRTKISDADVVELRRRYAAGEKRRDLAREYGITYGNVWAIGTGRSR